MKIQDLRKKSPKDLAKEVDPLIMPLKVKSLLPPIFAVVPNVTALARLRPAVLTCNVPPLSVKVPVPKLLLFATDNMPDDSVVPPL